jgi:hypothetical protein
MSITIKLDLPEDVVAKARAKGLLNSAQLSELIAREVAHDGDQRDFFQMARDLRSQPGDMGHVLPSVPRQSISADH